MMGIYSTNFGETPYCCPLEPEELRGQASSNGGLGIDPTIYQMIDAGQNGVLNVNGTVLLGD